MKNGIFRALTLALFFLCALLVSGEGHAQATVEYIHTDALGTPVAVTNATGVVIERSEYEPYGQLVNRPLADGPGFTGHVQDAATGLTYMQQRYYDPLTGRFLSVDPVTAYSSPGANFNRYWYANNNPYKFKDPDGRIVETAWDAINIGIGVASFVDNAKAGRWGAATVDALGVVVDSVAAAVPVVPGGAGTAIKLARGADAVSDSLKTVDKASDAAKAADAIVDGGKSAPDFIVSSGGTAFPVPKGAQGPTPVINPSGKQTGVAFTGGKGGANGQVSTMRIMDPTPAKGASPGYPNGYIKYENTGRQGVDPYSGKTIPNTQSHYPID